MPLLQSLLKYLTPVLTALVLSTPVGAAPAPLLLGIAEGSSNAETYAETQEKYRPLAHYLSVQLHRPIMLESSRSLSSLDYNLKNRRYDLVLVRAIHIAAQAMRDDGYRPVASAKGDVVMKFIVRVDSPISSPADLNGKSIALPDEHAFATRVARAMLRDRGIQPNQFTPVYYRQQDAVANAVQKKNQSAGVLAANTKVAKNWVAQGGRDLWSSPKLPSWPILASSNVDEATLNAAKAALLGLGTTPDGSTVLKSIGMEGFVAAEPAPYLAVLKWVEK